MIRTSHGLRFSLCVEKTFRKPFRPGGSELFGSVCLLLWQTVSILTVCPDGEVNLPHSVCFTPWRKPRWPTRPTNNTHTHTHTHTHTQPTFCHNSVVMWWECVCMGRASSLVSLLFAVGVLWLHVRPCLNPLRFVLSPVSVAGHTHTHTHRHPRPCAHYSEQTIASFTPTDTKTNLNIFRTLSETLDLTAGRNFHAFKGTVDHKNFKKYPILEVGNKSVLYNYMVWDYI